MEKYVVPSMMYAMNVRKWTKCELDRLEVIQNRVRTKGSWSKQIYVGVETIR